MLDSKVRAALTGLSTATLTSQLLKRGLRNTFLAGLAPQRSDLRLVGVAFTLRYVPAREDLGYQVDYDNDRDVQRLAVEAISPGQVLVIDARGETGAASFGAIIATRVWKRGAAGVVTDGALRDRPSFASIEMPTYCRGSHATTSSTKHIAVDTNVPIGCAGVLVMPGDVMVGDAEGVVAIPAALVDEIAAGAADQELVEAFALDRVQRGESIREVYPLAEKRQAEFNAWVRGRAASKGTEP